MFCSFVTIFEFSSKMYCTRFEKYRSKLRVSRSFVDIFEILIRPAELIVFVVKIK